MDPKVMKNIILIVVLIFFSNFFSIPISYADEKKTTSIDWCEELYGKDWKKNQKEVKEAFQNELKIIIPKAEAGDSEAQYQLGKHYDYGWGVDSNALEAKIWYEKAAVQGHVKAQHTLGMLNKNTNPKNFVKWLRAAAEQGDAESQYFLGRAYYDGEGTIRDYLEAVKWVTMAAHNGSAFGRGFLGIMYGEGKVLKKNTIMAYAWLNIVSDWSMYKVRLNELETKMSQQDILSAQKLSKELLQKYGKTKEPSEW